MKKLRELFSPQPPGTPSAMLLLPRIFEKRPWRTAKERTHPRCNSLTPAQVSPTRFPSLQRNCRGVLHLGRSLQSFLPWAAGLWHVASLSGPHQAAFSFLCKLGTQGKEKLAGVRKPVWGWMNVGKTQDLRVGHQVSLGHLNSH